jgi:two-component system nitrate/nitrite response regulator NarL
MPSLLFVDDHPLYRFGLKEALSLAMPGLEVKLAAGSIDALASLGAGDIDLCLSDHRLGAEDGLALLRTVGERFPTVARGVLCSSPTPTVARQAQDIGCVAVLSKDRGIEELALALGRLYQGETVFDLPTAGAPSPLSERRLQVLRLAAGGRSNKQIAGALCISERTVKDHWSAIFGQLAVGNRAEAVSRAHQLELL